MKWRREPERPSGVPGVAPAVLELAREIQAGIDRIAADPAASGELLTDLLDSIPTERRMELARAIFDALPAEQRWAVLERVFGDDELRAYLEEERAAALRERQSGDLARRAQADRALDTREIEPGEHLTLGLFRPGDVSAALGRGSRSSTCARRLVLRAIGDGTFRVLEDVFNPNGGYFVTAEYSEETWRTHERLDGHAVVRAGSLTGTGDARRFEPVVYAGGRVDVEVDGRATEGRLHLGFAIVSGRDVFVPTNKRE